MHLFLDACNPDIMAKLLEPAKVNGVDVENGWRVEVLIRPSTPKYNTTKKWRKTYMSVPEFQEYQEAIADIMEEQPEVEEEEPPVQKVTQTKRK